MYVFLESQHLYSFTIGEPQWLKLDSESDVHNESNNPGLPINEFSFPKIRPCINVGRLSEEILLAEHNGAGQIIKVGQLVEAWSRDR